MTTAFVTVLGYILLLSGAVAAFCWLLCVFYLALAASHIKEEIQQQHPWWRPFRWDGNKPFLDPDVFTPSGLKARRKAFWGLYGFIVLWLFGAVVVLCVWSLGLAH